MLERSCLLHTITRDKHATIFHPTRWFSHTLSASILRVQLVSLLLCLCLLGLSGCGQNTSSTQNTPQTGLSSDPTYVAIGASDTFGIGTNDPYTENWPSDLVLMLKQHIHLINLGIPGVTLHDALTSELPIALDAHPTLITIWLAVNDLAANVSVSSYSHDLNTLLSRLRSAAPHARIAVGNVPDLTDVPFFSHENPNTLDQQIAAYNTVIARCSHKRSRHPG